MEDTSDSQTPSFSHSLSLPSEPPDIRNWFPSFKYESFVWDTYDDFGGSIFKEIECEGDGLALVGETNVAEDGNWDESERNRNGDDKPPHIRNWFPCYETPALDTVDDSLKSLAKESEREEGFGIEGSQKGAENFQEFRNSKKSKDGVAEPPDITNQFHSCVHGSPVPGESGEFSHKEAEGQEFDFVNQNSSREKEINPKKFGQTKSPGEVVVDEKIHMNEFLKFNSSLADDKQENQPLDKMPHSLYSSSIPSEPPHIRNWFPSYETPVFDTGDDFLKSVAKESESEDGFAIEGSKEERQDDFLESSNSGNKNEVGAGEKLCSNQFARLKSSFGDVYEKKTLSEIPESPQSSSVASEPPETRNGFHVCVHESPLLSGSDEFAHKEIEGKKSDSVDQNRNKEREINLKFEQIESSDEVVVDEKVHMTGFLKFNSSFEDEKQESQPLDKGNRVVRKKNSSNGDNLRRKTEQRLEDRTFPFPNQGISLTKDVKKSNFLNDEFLLRKQQAKQNCPAETGLVLLKSNTTSSNNDRKSGTGLIDMKGFIENLEAKAQIEVGVVSSGSNARFIQVSGASMEKPAEGRNDKENGGNEASGNGFVTTRKGRITRSNDENSWNRPNEILLECSRNKGRTSSVEEKDAIVKRKVLSERTNFENSAANETTGKWKCPRKCKPRVGPPLKQLRLERWVRRL